VNPSLLSDPTKLIKINANTESGDPTRANFLFQQLTGTSLMFAPNTGIGTAAAPYSADLTTFVRQVLSLQGEAAGNAHSLAQGQTVVVNALQQRIADDAGVNVDQEMAYLISLQTAYAANARVMSVVQEMLNTLMKM
jgi:flagellar hook-associated protein 1 FlgK